MDAHELQQEYQRIRPQYDAFATRLSTLLESVLNAERIAFAQIEHRAKTVESFLRKVERKQYSKDLLTETTD